MRYNSHNTCFTCDDSKLNVGESRMCDISSSHLFAVLLNCYFFSLFPSSINPQNFSFRSALSRINEIKSKSLGFSIMNANETRAWVLTSKYGCCCVCWFGVGKRIMRVSTFFSSYSLYVLFVLLIGGSFERDDGWGECGRLGERKIWLLDDLEN